MRLIKGLYVLRTDPNIYNVSDSDGDVGEIVMYRGKDDKMLYYTCGEDWPSLVDAVDALRKLRDQKKAEAAHHHHPHS